MGTRRQHGKVFICASVLILSFLISHQAFGQDLSGQIVNIKNEISSLKSSDIQYKKDFIKLDISLSKLDSSIFYTQKKVDSLLTLHNALSSENESLKNNLNTILNIAGTANDRIDHQLTTFSIIIGIIAIITGLIGAILVWYISYTTQKTLKALEEGKNIKKEMENLKNDIETDLPKVFKQIQREELNELLKLVEADILKVREFYGRFLALPLELSDYNRFKRLLEEYLDREIIEVNEPAFTILVLLYKRFPKETSSNDYLYRNLCRYSFFVVQSLNVFEQRNLLFDSLEKLRTNSDKEFSENLLNLLTGYSHQNYQFWIENIRKNIDIDRSLKFKILELIPEDETTSFPKMLVNDLVLEFMGLSDLTEAEKGILQKKELYKSWIKNN